MSTKLDLQELLDFMNKVHEDYTIELSIDELNMIIKSYSLILLELKKYNINPVGKKSLCRKVYSIDCNNCPFDTCSDLINHLISRIIKDNNLKINKNYDNKSEIVNFSFFSNTL